MSFNSFVAGAVIGGGLVYGALSYHILRTDTGIEFVPKTTPMFAEAYLDVRHFTANDWARHKATTQAIVAAKKTHLFTAMGLSAIPGAEPVQQAGHTAEAWPTPWPGR
ncbi:MAG: hypothetical protein JSS27_13905 [Planctomycetes bacterium]|nr:hypothetical protein [Planctomycetota bacterium]